MKPIFPIFDQSYYNIIFIEKLIKYTILGEVYTILANTLIII